MSQYEAIKRKKLIRRKMKQILTSLLLVIVFILWGIYGLLQSDFFNLKNIQINGIETITAEVIIQASGLIKERNLFKYNLTDVGNNIVKHPYVESVNLERKLPNEMIINITERSEYAIIAYMGSYLFIDSQGVVLKVEDSYISQELPLITGAVFDSFVLGQKADVLNPQDLMKALNLLEAARLTDMIDNISEINIAEKDNVRLITFDGIEVLMGEATDPVYLILALQEVLVNLYTNNRRNVMIDMRYEGNITVKQRNQQ